MKNIQNNNQGFSWQELVIALAITGLIALIAGLTLAHSMRENRDLKRVSDIKSIQHALELYFYDCNEYPSSLKAGGTLSGVEECGGSVYLSFVPLDPSGVAYRYIPCKDDTIKDCSEGLTDPGAYQLFYSLESNTEELLKGSYVAVPGSLY